MMSEEPENVNTSEMLDFQGEESMKASGDADSTIKDTAANDGNEETDKTNNDNKEQESAEVTGDDNTNKEDGNTDMLGENADSKGEGDESNNAKKTDNESQEEEYMDILGNKTLLKKVIEAGSGDNPQMGERVTIDVQKTMPELDKQLPAEQITFTLGDCDVEQALDLAVSLMKLGEKATVISGYKYMYGEIGLAPDIPAFANFKLDVHLLTNHGFPNFGKLDLQERISEAKKKKDRGNFYFRRKDFSQAVYVYTKASKIVDPDEGCVYPDASPEKLQELLEFRGVILTNTSIAQLKIGAIDAAIKSATEATKLCPSYSKAYFRLGQAYEQKGSIDEAIKAHKAALKNDPENSKIIHNELSRLTKINKEAKQSQKEMYSKMFWGSNPPDMAKKSNIKEGPSLTNMHAALNTIPSDHNLSLPPWLNPQLLMNNPMFEAGVKAGRESLASDADLETTLRETVNFVEKMSNGEISDPTKLMQMAGRIQSVIPSNLDAYMRNHFEEKMQNLTSAEVAETQEYLFKSFPGLLKNLLKEPAKQPTDGMNDQLDQLTGLDLDQSAVKVPAHAVGVQSSNVDQKADGPADLGGEGLDGNHSLLNANGLRNSHHVGNLDVSEGLYKSAHKWSLDAINKHFRDLYQPKELSAMAKKRMNHLNHCFPKRKENNNLLDVSNARIEGPKEPNGANNGMYFGVRDKVPPASYNQHEVPANLEGQTSLGHSTAEMGHQLHSCTANTTLDTLMAFDTSPTIDVQSVFGHVNSEYDGNAPHKSDAHTLHRSISLTNPNRKTVPLYDVRKSFSTANIHYFRNGLVDKNSVRIFEPSEMSLCHERFEEMTSSSSGFLSEDDRYATLIQAIDNTSLNMRFKTMSTERIDSDFATAFQQKPRNCSFKQAEVTRFLLKSDNLKISRDTNAFNVPRQDMDRNEGVLSDTERDLDDSLTASSSLSMESLDTILMNEENTKALGPIIDDLQEEDKRWYSDLRTCSNPEKQPEEEDTKIVFRCDQLEEDTKIVFGFDPHQEDTKIVFGCDPNKEDTKIVFGCDPNKEDTKIVLGCDPHKEDTKIVFGCDPNKEDTKIVFGCDPNKEDTKIVFGCDPNKEDTKIVFGCDPNKEDTKIVFGCDPHQEDTKIVFGFDPHQEDTKIVFGCDPNKEDTKIVFGCDPNKEDTKIVLGCDPHQEDTKIVVGCDPHQEDTNIVFGCDPHQEDTKIVFGCDPNKEDTEIVFGCDPNKEDTKIVFGCDPNKEDTKIVFGCDPNKEDTKIVFGCDPNKEDTKIVLGCDPHQGDTKIVFGCDPHQEDSKIVFGCDPHQEDTKIVFGCDPHKEDTQIVVGCDPHQEDTQIVFGCDPHKEDTQIVFGCDPHQEDTKIVVGCDPHQEDSKIVFGCDPHQEETKIVFGCDPHKEDTQIVVGCDPHQEDTQIVFGCDPHKEDTQIVFGCDPHQEDTKIVFGCDPHQEDTKIVFGCDPYKEDTKIELGCDPPQEDTKIELGCDPHKEDTKTVLGCDPPQEDTKIVFGFDPHLDEFSCRIRSCIVYQDIIEDLEKILTTGGNVKEWLGMCKLLKQNERFRSDPSHKSDTNTKARCEDEEVKVCGDEIKKVPTETKNMATPVIDTASTKEVRKSHAHKKRNRHQLIRHENQPCSVEKWKEIEGEDLEDSDKDEDVCLIHDVAQPSLSFEKKKPITNHESDLKMDFQDHMKIWQDVIYDITRRSSQTDNFDKTRKHLLDERVRSDMMKTEYKKLMKNRYLGVLEELVRKHGPNVKNETGRAMVPHQPYMTSDHCCYRVNKYLKSVKVKQERMKQWQEVIYEVHRKSGDTGPVDVPAMAVDNQLLEERIRDDMMKAEKRKRSKTQHQDVLQELLKKYNKIKSKMANREAERTLKSKQLSDTRENHCEEENAPLEIQEREDVSKCNMEMERPMTNNEPKGMLSSEQLLQTTENHFEKERVPLEIPEREEERKCEPEIESTTTNNETGGTLTLEQLLKNSENHCHYVSPITMEALGRENERMRRLETEIYQKRARRLISWESDVDTGYAYPLDLDPECLLVHMQTELYQKRARRFSSWESDVDTGCPHEWLLNVDPQHLIVNMDFTDDQLDDMYSWLKNPLLLGTIGAGVAGAVSFGLYRFYNTH